MEVAVITGASMGLGEEFARQLAARKENLALVARSGEKLAALAAELRAQHSIVAEYLACDLSLPGGATQVADWLREKGLRPRWLVNNAGFGTIGPFDSMAAADVHGMVALNCGALTDLCHALLPAMRLLPDARILNVASTASFQPVPYFAVYAATKSYVLSFSEALSEELRGSSVRVHCLCPGPTPTKFAERAGIAPALFEKGQSAADVVRMGLDATDRGRVVLVCQRGFLVALQRLVPRFVVRRAAAIIAKTMLAKARG